MKEKIEIHLNSRGGSIGCFEGTTGACLGGWAGITGTILHGGELKIIISK